MRLDMRVTMVADSFDTSDWIRRSRPCWLASLPEWLLRGLVSGKDLNFPTKPDGALEFTRETLSFVFISFWCTKDDTHRLS